ncbi:AraC family transcriptional regulator [Microvirga sp. ACRRW]|uniref:helix-turn-helix domain-containing protein n=1 Tax=Microvirga sp. ACRRW TaxID=2918205 RepID=UPI001EF6C7DC|nr:AraC family transcriptional regulator [Microvirga sp. ACRRW]MCG7393364.1 AraC family transcriptional regulator [Microvirga sp. ACRRW]
MLSLPLPFVVALLLLILLGQMLRHPLETRASRLFLALLSAYAVQSLIVGLRWGYGWTWILPLQSVLAALLAPLAWLCFRALVHEDLNRKVAIWLHGLPVACVLLLVALWPEGIDLVLIATFLGYGLALARLARKGPDALSRASFEGAVSTSSALWATAVMLLLSAMLEVIVALDLTWSGGAYAAMAVGIGNVVALLVLGLAAAIAGGSQSGTDTPSAAEDDSIAEPADEDVMIVAKLDRMMREKRPFEDLDLSLERLARKTLIPARRISSAINRVTGKNVSQYINDHRIAEACRLLTETDEPITTIMFKAGFQTKSNFNREFRRVTEMSPRAWRTTIHRKDEIGAAAWRQGVADLTHS